MNDQRPVLVTGATGFIGMEVVRQLVAQGLPVRAMFRRRHRAALISPLPVDLVMANLAQPDTLARAVAGCRAVIHLAGRATFERYDRIAPSIVDGTDRVASAAAREGIERFVFGSSLFVHGPSDGPTVDAASSTTPVLDYGRAKLLAEQAVAAHRFPDGTLSVRLAHVYGALDLLFGFLRRGVLPFPADMDGVFPHQHVSDAARFLVACAEGEIIGAVPVSDELPVSWRHFFDVVRLYLGSARIVPLPPGPSRLAAAVIERLVPARLTTMATADTIRGWNLELRTKPGTMGIAGLESLHPTVDSGIPAVFDSAIPYRWRHPVLDHRRP